MRQAISTAPEPVAEAAFTHQRIALAVRVRLSLPWDTRHEIEVVVLLTMALLALSVTAFVATRPFSAFAQSSKPKVGNKPLVQIKPQPPIGCKLVRAVKGTFDR